MYRLAIFDFDGTLADSASWFVETLNAAAGRFGYRAVSLEEIETLRGVGNREIVRRLGVPAWKLPAIARHFRAEAARCAERIRLFDGARDCLVALADAGVELAVVSSNSEGVIRRVLGTDAALVSRFSCGASLFGKAAMLKRLRGTTPRNVIAIGDETRDIEAAKAAGVASGAVTWGYASREALLRCDPDHVFGSFDEMVALVAGTASAGKTFADEAATMQG